MCTIYNPYIEHKWYYQGKQPTNNDYKITLTYLRKKKMIPDENPRRNSPTKKGI